MNSIQILNRAADNIRILAASAVEKAKSGHPGGAMGGADYINVLYSEFLEYDPQNPTYVIFCTCLYRKIHNGRTGTVPSMG